MNDLSLHDSSLNAGQEADQHDIQVAVNVALVARVEALEAENKTLKKQVTETKSYFRIKNNSLIRFYTGFAD